MKRALILDGTIYPDIYGPTAQWRELLGDVPSDSVHVPSGEHIPDLAGYTHLVVTGSEASITKPEPWYEREVECVRRAVERGVAVLGSCFGHQILAVALSGAEHAAPSPTPELGWIQVEITADDPLLEGLPSPFWVFASHFDEVPSPPEPWHVLARSERCAVHVMRHGDDPVWGIQAHPEITPEQGRVLLEGFLEKAPEKADLVRAALEGEVRDDLTAPAIVRNFLAAV
jgi:GMP synthase-like glutamine amidotransferase